MMLILLTAIDEIEIGSKKRRTGCGTEKQTDTFLLFLRETEDSLLQSQLQRCTSHSDADVQKISEQ